MPSVLIIDDHLLIRYGLRRMLSQEYRQLVIGEAKSAEEAEIWLAKRPWDLVILALALPFQDGFYVLQEIRHRYVSTRVLVLTMHTDSHYALRARQTGASGESEAALSTEDLLWYAIRVQSKFENLASATLRGKGYEEFLPLYRSRRRWSDRVKQLDLPLFPGYLFCNPGAQQRRGRVARRESLRVSALGRPSCGPNCSSSSMLANSSSCTSWCNSRYSRTKSSHKSTSHFTTQVCIIITMLSSAYT